MICLSKNRKDEYVNMFAQGANMPIDEYGTGSDEISEPVLIRGLGKRKLIQERWKQNLPFYYMDSGYLGNYPSKTNPRGFKVFHRIVKNDLQHKEIVDRPDNRLKKLDVKVNTKRKHGDYILLVTPSEKPCKFYGIDLNKWKDETLDKLNNLTDRKIKIREKKPRKQRVQKTIFEDLKDCHALVTFQSIAAVESIISGVPAFTMAPTAADPVCNKNLENIESPDWQDSDTIYKWACHLAYGQFHNEELKDGKAYRILMHE